ncbi:hypothetical protein DB459_15940 [Bradyrhizobium sp. WD16]|nr:hypothetical protein DB459_15940 [Bradyrhizobium sp. WD16]
MPAEIPDDLQRLMARAFDRAWERFARPGMASDIAVMRAELARCIVALVRQGERDERRLSLARLLPSRLAAAAHAGPEIARAGAPRQNVMHFRAWRRALRHF